MSEGFQNNLQTTISDSSFSSYTTTTTTTTSYFPKLPPPTYSKPPPPSHSYSKSLPMPSPSPPPPVTHSKSSSLSSSFSKEEIAPEWQMDNKCYDCLKPFTMTLRRHHCRNCGNSCCGPCSEKEFCLGNKITGTLERVCNNCYYRLANLTLEAVRESSEGKQNPQMNYQDINQSWQYINAQAKQGLRTTANLCEFLKTVCNAKQAMAQDILKRSTPNLDSLIDHGRMPRYDNALTTTREMFVLIARQETNVAENINKQIIEPLVDHYNKAVRVRKAISKEHKKLAFRLNSLLTEKARQKKILIQAINLLKQKTKEYNLEEFRKGMGESMIDNTTVDNTTMQNLSASRRRTNVRTMRKRVETLANRIPIPKISKDQFREETYNMALRYRNHIAQCNVVQKEFYNVQQPLLLAQMQQLEQERLEISEKLLPKSCALQIDCLAICKKDASLFSEKVGKSMDSVKDIEHFVEDIMNIDGESIEPESFAYDIPLTPSCLKNNTLDGDRGLFFNHTIEEIMEIQESSHPGLNIPSILVDLANALRKLGGIKTEGIFLRSCETGSLDAGIRQLETLSKYTPVRGTSPNVPASLIKAWLRDLREPLFPWKLYGRAIELAMDTKCGSRMILNLFQELDPTRQAILRYLCDLFNEISDHQTENTSFIQAIAIPFTPVIMKNPSENLEEIRRCAKYETRFVSMLFTAVCGNDVFTMKKIKAPVQLSMVEQKEGIQISYSSMNKQPNIPTTGYNRPPPSVRSESPLPRTQPLSPTNTKTISQPLLPVKTKTKRKTKTKNKPPPPRSAKNPPPPRSPASPKSLSLATKIISDKPPSPRPIIEGKIISNGPPSPRSFIKRKIILNKPPSPRPIIEGQNNTGTIKGTSASKIEKNNIKGSDMQSSLNRSKKKRVKKKKPPPPNNLGLNSSKGRRRPPPPISGRPSPKTGKSSFRPTKPPPPPKSLLNLVDPDSDDDDISY